MAPPHGKNPWIPAKTCGNDGRGIPRTLLSCLFSVCHWYEDEWYEDGHNEVRNLGIPASLLLSFPQF